MKGQRLLGTVLPLLIVSACSPSEPPSADLLSTDACEPVEISSELGLPPTKEAASQFLNGWWPSRGNDWLRALGDETSLALATDGRAHRLLVEAELREGEVAASLLNEGAAIALPTERLGAAFAIDVSSVPAGHHVLRLTLPTGSRARRARLQFDSDSDASKRNVLLCDPPQGTLTARWQRGSSWKILSGLRTVLGSESLGPSGNQSFEISDSPAPIVVVREPDSRLTLHVEGSESTEHRPATAPSKSAPRPDIVLLYVQDALRADAIDRLPEASVWKRLNEKGVLLGQHRSVAPNTLPSTKALFTGRVATSGGGRALSEDLPTLAEAFRDAGFRTGLFSNNPWISEAYGVTRGFDFATDALPQEEEPFFDDVSRVHAAALDWLRSAPLDGPLFLYLHVLHPHNPYDPPQALAEHCVDAALDGSTKALRAIRDRKEPLSEAQEERLRCLYQGSLEHADAELKVFLDELRALQRSEAPLEVLTVLTSDHGEEFFEHQGVLHGYTLFEEQLRIPLVAHWPGRLERRTVTEPTSTLNVHAALRALARGASPDSFEAVLTAPQDDHFAAAASVRGGIFSLQRGDLKLIWAPRRGREWGQGQGFGRRRDVLELFELSSDPNEQHPLPLASRRLSTLWQDLRAQTAETADGGEEDESLDPEIERRLRALGYLDG